MTPSEGLEALAPPPIVNSSGNRNRRKRRLVIRAVGLIAAIAIGAVALTRTEAPASVPDGDPIELRLIDPNGTPKALSSMRGRPLLLHVWATYCGPCRAEMPELLGYLDAGHIPALLLSVDEDIEALRRFFPTGMPIDSARANPSEVAATLGIYSVPETFLLDPAGRIIERYHGPQNWDDPLLRRKISRSLAAYAPTSGR